jgi:hypothetical protein
MAGLKLKLGHFILGSWTVHFFGSILTIGLSSVTRGQVQAPEEVALWYPSLLTMCYKLTNRRCMAVILLS